MTDCKQLNSDEIKISEIEIKLAMSPEERIESHQKALALLEDLKRAGENLGSGSTETSKNSTGK